MDYTVHRYPGEGFIKLGDKLGGMRPLRRTLSLMEILGCKTYAEKSVIWDQSNPCLESGCKNHFEICKSYINNLHLHDFQFVKKHCHKICFFNSEFEKPELISSQDNDNLIGFCIVHEDDFIWKDKPVFRRYVFESCVLSPHGMKSYILKPRIENISIKGKGFNLEGNYFSQKNAATDSCVHVAIKMALRNCSHEITSEEINNRIGNPKGSKGLSIEETRKAIESLTNQNTLLLDSSNFDTPLTFLKIIYYAIESRLPVILLFQIPVEFNEDEYRRRQTDILKGRRLEELTKEELKIIGNLIERPNHQTSGHAIAIMGHTLNEHTWWSYALKDYFFPNNKYLQYLPSLIWCDNLIVHDDNLGPYYLLPVRFLVDIDGADRILSSLRDLLINIPIQRRRISFPYPINAIITHPNTTTLS